MSRDLTTRALLDVWERAVDEPAVVRPAVLVAAAAGRALDEVMQWDIGRRDAALIDLRVALFGPTADAVCSCPLCDTRLDVLLDFAVIGPDRVCAEPVTVGSYRVQHRLPTTADLMALCSEPEPYAARMALVRLALVSVEDVSGAQVPFDALSDGEQSMVAATIADAQSGIDVRLTLHGACGHEWVAPFDIGAFLLRELEDFVEGLLREVHALAGAFGWSESTILDLSARRRRAYLGLVGAL